MNTLIKFLSGIISLMSEELEKFLYSKSTGNVFLHLRMFYVTIPFKNPKDGLGQYTILSWQFFRHLKNVVLFSSDLHGSDEKSVVIGTIVQWQVMR